MFCIDDLLQGNQGRISIQGDLVPPPDLVFRSARHDSRECGLGDLYVAIKGARVDGHRFIPDVARAGCSGVLCTTPHPEAPAHLLQFIVPDVVKALQLTARHRVLRQPETIKIGITGSNGKTTTKEAIAAVLSASYPTLKTQASYNNELGYPLTLLQLETAHRYAVLEMGAEWVGELRSLCETVARPDWSVITMVGSAHLKHFGTLENVAIAKSELVQVLAMDGIALLNYDDPAVRAMKEKTQARVIYYSREAQTPVHASSIETQGLFGSRFTLHIGDQELQVKLALPGPHGITTALAAAAVGYAASISIDVIRDALETLSPVKGRGEVRQGAGPNDSTLIDDTFNANRQSLIAMAQALNVTPLASGGKRWLVLGELLEQGEQSQQEHYASGKELGGIIDRLVVIGDYARYLVASVQEAGIPPEHIYYFPAHPANEAEVEECKQRVAELLKRQVTADDLVLVKGSRGMRMETLFPLLS